MNVPLIPDNETERLCSLYKLAILDTEPEQRYDFITEKVKNYFAVPVVLITLIDDNRQWIKSSQGTDVKDVSREISFCGHAINQDNIFIISDTHQDERFRNSPLVINAPFVRFYAGAPIKTPEGYKVGTLCLIDISPRVLTDNDQVVLREFADMVENELKIQSEDNSH